MSVVALLAAVVYVMLGFSSAWHAPHFSQGSVAIHGDRHTGGHEYPATGDCALCAYKTAAQHVAPANRSVVQPVAFEPLAFPRPESPVHGHFRAALARGPPSLS